MVRPCGHALALALCALSLLFACAAAASVSVTLEPNPVHLDESFSVVFKAGKAPDGEPDFSPLKKSFTILGQSRSSHISIINGDYNKTIEWTLTLMAKREGQLTIPPIAFGNDRSEPVTVTVAGGAVADAGRDAEVFLEVEAEPKNPYVQAQILYTVRVLVRRGASLNSADLSEPSLADALIEKLGDDKSYAASREGLGYRVIERKYAIFPQKSGPAVIEPMVLEAQLSAGGHSVFDRFFNHLPSRTLRVRSGAVPLQVKAVPAAFTGKRWLPASKLELEEAWSKYPPQTTAGEPITRTLSLKAESATVGLLPELAPKLPARKPGEEIKQYPDQPFLNEEKHFNGINSIRQEKTALVITEAGDYTLPGLEIPWWNTRTDQMQIARIPERLVSVLPAPQTSQQPAQVAPPAAETPTQPASRPRQRHRPQTRRRKRQPSFGED